MVKYLLPAFTFLLVIIHITTFCENIVFPSSSGFVDVTQPPYNAPKDGVQDATSAINTAIKDHIGSGKSIYFPNGTYLISSSIVFPQQAGGNNPSRITIQGQSQAGTIIKLKPNCEGFTNANLPKAVMVTGHDVAQCFHNNVRNLTINTNTGNTGAIGLRYYSNNTGTVSNVTIRSGDGSGVIGLDLYWQNENGPLLAKNITVDGFNIGVNAGSCQNSQTIEHITLRNQKQLGIKTQGGVLSIRNLISENSVPVINNTGIMTCIGASCTGGASTNTAIINSSTLYIRNFSAQGYKQGIENTSGTKTGLLALNAVEWSSHQQISLNASGSGMLNLPIKETPEIVWDPVSEWQVVNHPGDGSEATSAIQSAIDAGKTTIYFKPGKYKISNTIHVRGAVRTVYGFGSNLDIYPTGTFLIENGTSSTVIFENFAGGYGNAFFVTHASTRTVAIKNVLNWGVKTNAGCGDLFLEDMCANPWTKYEFHGGNIWARQLNPENEGTHILNNGATLWILGLKTERGGTLIETKSRGKTEVCGFFAYTTTDPKGSPMFIVNESQFSAVGSETTYGTAYSTFVQEILNGTTKSLLASELPKGCANGHTLPFYVCKEKSTKTIHFTTKHNDTYRKADSSDYYSINGQKIKFTKKRKIFLSNFRLQR